MSLIKVTSLGPDPDSNRLHRLSAPALRVLCVLYVLSYSYVASHTFPPTPFSSR